MTKMKRLVCLLSLTGMTLLGGAMTVRSNAADLTSSYSWNPVRIGAGGFVTGIVVHPQNASVRYCRTDVGNAYRWDGSEWRPMIVRNGSSGVPANVGNVPTKVGVESIAVDPNNTNVVLLSFQTEHSADLKATYPDLGGNVYRSTDGGLSFSAGNLSIKLDANGVWRDFGERMNVDPNNGQVVYYGSITQGLWRSLDGGVNWSQVTAN